MAVNWKKLREQQEEKKNRKGGDVDYKKIVFKLKVGTNKIRLVPNPDDAENPFITVIEHNAKRVFTPFFRSRFLSLQTFGEEDPIVEYRKYLYGKAKEAGGKETSEGKEYWEFANTLNTKTRYMAYVIDRDNEEDGIKIWDFSQDTLDLIFGAIDMEDVDEEERIGDDITDLKSGHDLTIKCNLEVSDMRDQKTGKNIEYASIISIKPKLTATKVMADMADWKLVSESYPKAFSLFKKLTHDELTDLLNKLLESIGSSSDEEDDEEEAKEEKPKVEVKKETVPSKKVKETVDEEEVVEEEVKPKKPLAKSKLSNKQQEKLDATFVEDDEDVTNDLPF